MKRKPSRRKKLIRVLKRKWYKPALYTIGMSLLIYVIISNTVIQKNKPDSNPPHFLITRISNTFEQTEFMHLLLTIQELRVLPQTATQLIEFANSPYPTKCPKMLELELNRMNWAPYAFQSRIQKLFSLLKTYERISRLNETIEFFKNEQIEGRLSHELLNYMHILEQERNNIMNNEITAEEYEFISEYAGLVQLIKKD